MKRLWITLTVVILAAIVTLPALAVPADFCDKNPDHQRCSDDPTTTTTTTEPPDEVVCQFDGDGKLLGYTGMESAPYKCEWTIDSGEYSFELKAADGASQVLRPHLFVTDAYPIGDKCFDQMNNGWQELPYTFGPFTLPTDGACNSQTYNITDSDTDDPDNVYGLTIAARAKGAALELWLCLGAC